MFKLRVPSNFTKADLLFALKLLDEKVMGRKKLSDMLFLGEASIRSILSKLRGEGFLESKKSGQVITQRGREFLKAQVQFELPKKIEKLEITLGEVNLGILLHSMEDRVEDGLKQRDSAVFAGASGATTLIFKEKFIFPKSRESIPLEENNHLLKMFKPKNGDVLCISSAEDERRAFRGLVFILDGFL
ncbi:MAG: DUF4443 domain-containing protein [Candidatus Methanofastidiosia archaeon]